MALRKVCNCIVAGWLMVRARAPWTKPRPRAPQARIGGHRILPIPSSAPTDWTHGRPRTTPTSAYASSAGRCTCAGCNGEQRVGRGICDGSCTLSRRMADPVSYGRHTAGAPIAVSGSVLALPVSSYGVGCCARRRIRQKPGPVCSATAAARSYRCALHSMCHGNVSMRAWRATTTAATDAYAGGHAVGLQSCHMRSLSWRAAAIGTAQLSHVAVRAHVLGLWHDPKTNRVAADAATGRDRARNPVPASQPHTHAR